MCAPEQFGSGAFVFEPVKIMRVYLQYMKQNEIEWLKVNYADVEYWIAMPGYEGAYMISSWGRAKSIRFKEDRILKPCANKNTGYIQYHLSKNNKQINCYAHRKVGEAFIPNPNNLHCINHRDENIKNNRVDNLEWVSQKENVNYRGAQERRVESLRKFKNTNPEKYNKRYIYHMKPVAQYTLEGILVTTYPSLAEAGRQTGFLKGQISRCCNKKQKSAYGYIWKFI